MEKVIMFFLFVLLAVMVSAQNISNVDFHQVGDEIVITYDLDESADNIWLYVSLDGGKRFYLTKNAVGDVGVKTIHPGKKRIIWKVLSYVPEGLVGQVQFKVSKNLLILLDGVEIIEMIYVKGGTFKMGATSEQGSEGWAEPVHTVTLSDYFIGKFEVTQGLWKKVMGMTMEQYVNKNSKASLYGVGPDYPMYYVEWEDAQEFCTKLNQLLGFTSFTFCLPTEAQWEYAARGGAKSKGYRYSGSDTIGDIAWFWGNSEKKYSVSPVGQKQANELGVYDMSGNVAEWCSDWFALYSSDAHAQTDPTGPSSEPPHGIGRVYRGGSWGDDAMDCRVSSRVLLPRAYRPRGIIGFRVVLLIPENLRVEKGR